MRLPIPKPAPLGLFWFGIQVVWGALLGVSLQARASQLGGSGALAAYAALASGGALVAAATQIGIGVISDRRRLKGSRRVEFYGTGALVAAGALFWFYCAPSFPQLAAAVFVLQIGMNLAIGPYQAVIPDFIADDAVGRASSWMAGLQSVGNACGAVIAGLIEQPVIVAGAIGVLLLGSCAITAAHVRRLRLLPARWEPMRVSRAFVDLFVSRALVYAGFYTVLGYLYFYVEHTMGGPVKTMTAIVLLLFTVAGALGAALGAIPSDRRDRRGVASVGGCAFALSLLAFLLAHSFVAVAASALLAGAAWGLFLTADWALGCRFLPRFALATAMGIWNLALLIPQVVAPLLATLLLSALHALQSAGAPRTAFLLAGIEVLAGIAWIWRLPASRSLG